MVFIFMVFGGLLLGMSSCTSVRPIVKIGLIAPFEGLYRESGYAALEAMRQAMAECTPAGIDVLPLALDDSGDPMQAQRAAQKLLIDPTVKAVVGPLLLDAVPAVSSVMTHASGIPWLVPALVAPEGGFANPQTSAWLEAQVDFVASHSSATRVLLLGLPTAWSLPVNASTPVLRVNVLDGALATVGDGDALLWLGRPDVGARWLAALRVENPDTQFWLANQAGLAIFVAQPADLDAIQWLLLTDFKYNLWSHSDDSPMQPSDATRYLVYRATCDALAGLAEASSVTQDIWQLQSRPLIRPNSE